MTDVRLGSKYISEALINIHSTVQKKQYSAPYLKNLVGILASERVQLTVALK